MLRGTPIDDNPEFLGWVELWISGAYDMSELRSRYNDITDRPAQRLRPVPVALEPTVTDAEQIDIPSFDTDPIYPNVWDDDWNLTASFPAAFAS